MQYDSPFMHEKPAGRDASSAMIRRMLRDSAENPSDPSEAPLASSPPLNANYEVNLLSPSSYSSAGLNILISLLRGFGGGCQYIKRFPIAGADSPLYGGQNYYALSAPSFLGASQNFPRLCRPHSVYRWRIKKLAVSNFPFFHLPSLPLC